MKTTLKIILGFVGLMTAFIILSFLCAGIWSHVMGKSWLEKKLQSQYGIQASVGRVSSNFFNSLTAENIVLTNPVGTQIKKARLAFHPWNLFNPNRQFKNIIFLYVDGLETRLDIDSWLSTFRDSRESSPPLSKTPPVTILLSNSSVQAIYQQKLIKVDEIEGEMKPDRRDLAVSLRGTGHRTGKLSANFNWKPDQKTFRLGINAHQADLNYLTTWAGDRWKEEYGQWDGPIDVFFNYSSTSSWRARIKGTSLEWRPKSGSAPLPLNVDLEGDSSLIRVHAISSEGLGHIRGSVQNPFHEAILDLVAHTEEFSYQRLGQLISQPDWKSNEFGWIEVQAQISGSAFAPKIEGSFNSKGRINEIRFPSVQGHFSYFDKKLEISSSAVSGGYCAQFVWDEQNRISGQIALTDLSLADLAKENNWRNVSGKLSSNIELKNRSTFSGPFTLKEFRWGRHPISEDIVGELDFNQRQFVVKTQDDRLRLNSLFKGKDIHLEQFRIAFDTFSFLTAHGTIDTRSNRINYYVDGKNLPPDLWPPLVSQYPGMSGGLDLNGTFFGTQQSPAAKMDLIFHDLRFRPSGQAWNGSTQLTWNGRDLNLKNIRVDGGYAGEINFQIVEPKPIWVYELNLEEANPQLIADVMRSELKVSGNMTGHLSTRIQDLSVVGVSTLTWKNVQIGSVSLDSAEALIKMKGNKFELASLNLIKGDQALRGDALLIRSQRNEWTYEATLQAQQVGTRYLRVDGEVRSSGFFNWPPSRIQGQLESSVLYLNGTPLDAVRLKWDRTGQWVSLKGESKPFLDFQFRIGLLHHSVKGYLNGTSLNLDDIYKKYFAGFDLEDVPSGDVDLALKVRGTWADPKIDASIKIPNARYSQEEFSTKAFLRIDRSTMTIESSKTVFANGGEVYANGVMGLDSPYDMQIDGAGSRLHLTTLFHLIGWNISWEGRTNAQFKLRGNTENRTMECKLDGSHSGFSPFSGGGPIGGRVKWRKNEWDLSGLTVETGEGYLRLLGGSRAIRKRKGAGVLHIVADARNLRAGILTMFGGVELTGTWAGSPQTKSPSPSRTVVDLDVFARSLWINQILLNGNVSHISVDRDHLVFSSILDSDQKLSGTLNYEDKNNLTARSIRLLDNDQERFYLDGRIGNSGWDFRLRAKEVDAHFLQGLLDTTFPVTGPIELNLTGKGTRDLPNIHGSLVWRNGHLGKIPVDNAVCDIHLKDQILRITNLQATKKRGYQVRGKFVLALSEEERASDPPTEFTIDLQKGDLSILKDIWPTVVTRAKGSFEGGIEYKDKLSGYLVANNVSLKSTSYLPSLKSNELRWDLNGDSLRVTKGIAHLNKGIVELKGGINYENGAPTFLDLHLNTLTKKGIAIRVPDYTIPPGAVLGRFRILNQKLGGVTRGEPIINVSLVGPIEKPVLSGIVKMDNTVFTYPGAPQKQEPGVDAVTRWWRAFRSNLIFDLLLQAGNNSRYENEYVSSLVSGQLKLEGPYNDLILNGRIDTGQGSIVYGGNEFKLNQAQLEVITSRPLPMDTSRTFVYLKAQAEREVFYTDARGNGNQDTIVMQVDRALIGEIQPRFYSRSNPNISPERALKLALGFDAPGINPESSFFAGTAGQTASSTEMNQALRLGLVQLLDTNLASPMARALARETGLVDYIRVTQEQNTSIDETTDPRLTDNTNANATQNEWFRMMKGTKVKFGRDLSNRLFADYSFKVDEYQNQVDLRHEVELAYRLHRNLFLRAISELDSQETLGRPPDRRALLENQWRFGLPRQKKKAEGNQMGPSASPVMKETPR